MASKDVQRVDNRRTLIKFVVQSTEYNAGVGASTKTTTISVPVGKDKTTDCFYCNWQDAYGLYAVKLQAEGVPLTARVRMPFIDVVYEALKKHNCKILKNGDASDAYELFTSVENIGNNNKTIEFQVKRWEGK